MTSEIASTSTNFAPKSLASLICDAHRSRPLAQHCNVPLLRASMYCFFLRKTCLGEVPNPLDWLVLASGGVLHGISSTLQCLFSTSVDWPHAKQKTDPQGRWERNLNAVSGHSPSIYHLSEKHCNLQRHQYLTGRLRIKGLRLFSCTLRNRTRSLGGLLTEPHDGPQAHNHIL